MIDREIIRNRSEITRGIRSFFTDRNYLEVETPILSPHLIPESSIENFRADLVSPYGPSKPLFLTPSPEIWMKVLLSRGAGDIFQIARSFRNSEQTSRIHNPEFTMLEWYKTGIDSQKNIEITYELIQSLCRRETPKEVRSPFRVMTMEEAFREFAGFSLEENISSPSLLEQNRRHSIPADESEEWEVLFHKLFLTLVEPSLPRDRPLVLNRYPSALETLAAEVHGTPWSDRWELYIRGVEVANCYTEETDPQRIRRYYRIEKAEKEKKALVPVISDPAYAGIFETFPPCSGTAVGVDRLIAQILDKSEIEGVILFPLNAILP